MAVDTIVNDQTQTPAPAAVPATSPVTNGQAVPASTPTPAAGVLGATPSPAVTNPPSPEAQQEAQHKGIFHSILNVLGGGPSVNYTYDANGKMQTQKTDKSNGDLAKMIVAGALTGLFAGAQEHGPGAGLRAFGAGGMASANMAKAMDEKKRAQAAADYQNQQATVLRKAQVFEANSRTVLNTAEAERSGTETLQKQIDMSAPLIEKARDGGQLLDEHITQQELTDGMKSGKYSSTAHMGPVDGYVQIPNDPNDPTKGARTEATHAIIADPNAKISLTQEDYDRFHAAHVPGFEKVTKVASGAQVSLATYNIWTQSAGTVDLAKSRVEDIRKTMTGTDYAKAIPTDLDKEMAKPGVMQALTKFQKYISHSGGDPYEALINMGLDKQDPKTGAMIQNPDAKYASLVAQTFGGWDVLRAYHSKITIEEAANKEGAMTEAEGKAKEPFEINKENREHQNRMSELGTENANATHREILRAGIESGSLTVDEHGNVARNQGAATQDPFGTDLGAPLPQKEFLKRQDAVNKYVQDKVLPAEQSYQMFQKAYSEFKSGAKTGAPGMVALSTHLNTTFGNVKGSRVTKDMIREHLGARSITDDALVAVQKLTTGDPLSKKQWDAFGQLIGDSRTETWKLAADQAATVGVPRTFLPRPAQRGVVPDPATARIYLEVAGGDVNLANQAMQNQGWK